MRADHNKTYKQTNHRSTDVPHVHATSSIRADAYVAKTVRPAVDGVENETRVTVLQHGAFKRRGDETLERMRHMLRLHAAGNRNRKW